MFNDYAREYGRFARAEACRGCPEMKSKEPAAQSYSVG
jgi:hypothetical protein